MRFLRYALLGCSLLGSASVAFGQTGTVTGRVTDAAGEGIPGASIALQGLNVGAAADIDGNFRFSAPAGTYVITASSVGYRRAQQPVTVASGATVTVDFRLVEDAAGLDELVVTGYGGEQERRNLSTAIVSVSGEQLRELPPVSVDAALQGRAAGVTVLQSSGTPGGGVSVRVRGATSVSGSNQPLYVIDGVPVSSGNFSSLGAGNQGTNALATIDPSEIADMQILKDAAATALYGTRAANGVVLITTRRGLSGRTQVEFEASTGSSRLPNDPDVLDATEYVSVYRQAIRNQTNPGVAPAYGTAIPADSSAVQTTNYYDAITQTGAIQNYRLNVSGGNAATRYRIGGSYSDETGAIIRSGFERYNGSLNVEHRWNDRASVFGKATYNRSVNSRIGNDNYIYGVLTNALLARPYSPIFQSDGVTYTPAPLSGPFSNPIAEAQTRFLSTDTKFLGNVDLSYDIVPTLTLRGSAGLDRFDFIEDRFAQSFTSQGAPNGAGAVVNTTFQNVILASNLIWRPTFLGEDHSLQVLTGVSQEDTRSGVSAATGSNYPLDQLSLVSSASTTTGTQTSTRSGLRSFLGSADYNYRGRYLATAAFRYDGSSRFGADNRYGFFPAFSLGWNVKEEAFLRNVSGLEQLKFRLSYGEAGQQEIGNFASRALFGAGGSYAGAPALAPTQLGNPSLQWESTSQFNVGLDFVVLRGRIGGNVDYYNKQTNDLLLNALLPLTSAFGGIQRNIGAVENRGLEFQLNTVNVNTGGFRWTSAFNIATNATKVLRLYDGNKDGKGDEQAAGFGSRVAEGQPLGAFYGYVYDGLFQNLNEICPAVAGETAAQRGDRCKALGLAYQNATVVNASTGSINPSGTYLGDRRFKDLNGDGLITADDQTFIGNPNPDFFGGFTNTFSFKGLELSGFLQFSQGNDVYNNTKAFSEQSYRTSGRLRDAWTPTNTDTDIARVTTTNPNNNARASSYLVEDGSYIRLKTLSLAYGVPTRYARLLGAAGIRLYTVGTNLWTSTKYSGLDPEVSTFDRSNTAFGTDFFTYPQARTFTFGARLTF